MHTNQPHKLQFLLFCLTLSGDRESLSDRIRSTMEHCDSLQSFLMLHSLGGGTGSGLGCYILELLEDEFPEARLWPSRRYKEE